MSALDLSVLGDSVSLLLIAAPVCVAIILARLVRRSSASITHSEVRKRMKHL